MSVRLGDRDIKVLAKCAKAQWLSTGQIASLFFGGVTPDAVRKSLRRLGDAGYLRAWRENRMTEAFHAVGPKGKSILEARGIVVEAHRTPPRQLAHLGGINEVRVAVERSDFEVAFFYAAWELGEFGWGYEVIPDAVFALKLSERSTFIVEYDRGTETVETVFGKIRRYDEGLRGFPIAAVLLVTETPRRLADLGRHARDEALRIPVFKGVLEDIRSAGIGGPVFCGLAGERGAAISMREIASRADEVGGITRQGSSRRS